MHIGISLTHASDVHIDKIHLVEGDCACYLRLPAGNCTLRAVGTCPAPALENLDEPDFCFKTHVSNFYLYYKAVGCYGKFFGFSLLVFKFIIIHLAGFRSAQCIRCSVQEWATYRNRECTAYWAQESGVRWVQS